MPLAVEGQTTRGPNITRNRRCENSKNDRNFRLFNVESPTNTQLIHRPQVHAVVLSYCVRYTRWRPPRPIDRGDATHTRYGIVSSSNLMATFIMVTCYGTAHIRREDLVTDHARILALGIQLENIGFSAYDIAYRRLGLLIGRSMKSDQ